MADFDAGGTTLDAFKPGAAPAPSTPDVRGMIDQSRKMGATDDQIRSLMTSSPLLKDTWKQSEQAGIKPDDVFAHFGIAPAASDQPAMATEDAYGQYAPAPDPAPAPADAASRSTSAPMPTLDEFGRDVSAPAVGQGVFNRSVNAAGEAFTSGSNDLLTDEGRKAIDDSGPVGRYLVNPALKVAGAAAIGIPSAIIKGGSEALVGGGEALSNATGNPGYGQFARGLAGMGESAMADLMSPGGHIAAPLDARAGADLARDVTADRFRATPAEQNAQAVAAIGKAPDIGAAIKAAADAVARPADATITVRPDSADIAGPTDAAAVSDRAARIQAERDRLGGGQASRIQAERDRLDAMRTPANDAVAPDAVSPGDALATDPVAANTAASDTAVVPDRTTRLQAERARLDAMRAPGEDAVTPEAAPAEIPAIDPATDAAPATGFVPDATPADVPPADPALQSVGAAASAADQADISTRDMKSNRRRAEKDEILAPAEPNDSTIHVDGSFPTLAERSADPIISQQENLIRQRNPGEFIGEGKRLTENNKARVAAYDDLTIADPTLDSMRDDRNERWIAASDDILPNAKPVDTTSITDWVQQQLSDPRIRENDDVRRVLEGFADRLIDRDGNPKTDPAALWGIHDNLQNQLSKAKDPLNSTGAEKYAVLQIQHAKSLVDQALNVSTDGRFGDVLANYAEDSKAINAGVLLNKFRNNLTNMHGELQAQRFHSFVLDLAEKRGKPGLDPSMDISDQAMSRLIAIDKDLKRAGLIKLGQAAGSPTNLLGALAAKAGYDAAKSAIGGVPVVGGLLKALPDYMAERKLQSDTARHLADPEGGYRYPERPDPAPPRQPGQQQAPTAPAAGEPRAPSFVGAASSTLDALDAEAARNGWRRIGPNEPLAPGQEVATAVSGRQYVKDDSPAPQAAAAPPTATPAPQAGNFYASTVTKTPDGRAVPIKYVVRDASSLVPSQLRDGRLNEAYPAELQPRDRTRNASLDQVSKMANTLDPDRLGYSGDTSTGAPVVGADGFVESGNGRMMAIQQAYAAKGISSLRYRAWLSKQGFDTSGMKNPVLVRERVGEMGLVSAPS